MSRYCKFNVQDIKDAVDSFYRQFHDTEFKLKGTYLTFCGNADLEENPKLGKHDQLKDFFEMEIFDIALNRQPQAEQIYPNYN
jgi:hypothetical protein